MSDKIQIRMEAYDHEALDQSAVEIVETKLAGLRAVRWVGRAAGREEESGLAGDGELTLRMWFLRVDAPERPPVDFGVVLGKAVPGGRLARAIRDGKPEPDVFVMAEATAVLLGAPLKKK